MRKKLVTMLLAVVVMLGAYFSFNYPTTVKASQSAIALYTSETANSTATSTAAYSSLNVASSTALFDPENGEVVQIFLASYSTSTPPSISFIVEYSNDNSLWYPWENETFSSSATLVAGTKGSVTQWSAATSSANETVTKTVTLPDNFAGKYGRVKYQANVSSTLHVEVAVKKQI